MFLRQQTLLVCQTQNLGDIARTGAADGFGVDDRHRARRLVERLCEATDGKDDRQIAEVFVLGDVLRRRRCTQPGERGRQGAQHRTNPRRLHHPV